MKKAKTKARLTLAALLVLTVLLTVLGVTGLPALGLKNWLPTTDAEKWPEALPLGLDLRGGVMWNTLPPARMTGIPILPCYWRPPCP